MSFCLDTSVLVPLLVRDALTARARRWLAAAPGEVLIGDLTEAEFAAAIGAKPRRRGVTAEEARAALGALSMWRVDAPPAAGLTFDLGMEAVARRLGTTITAA